MAPAGQPGAGAGPHDFPDRDGLGDAIPYGVYDMAGEHRAS